jgi:two-component system, OmpR family, alkaline phosphatase synthesis response regulator PhoP
MSNETILVIEDEKNILELVYHNLTQAGFRVLKLMRGDEAFACVKKNKPGLIVLDLMLPGLDGLGVCKLLKQNESTARIPIIILTAKSMETDKVVGLELGADDYVTKPFSPRELVARVKAVFRRVEEKPKSKILKAGELEVDLDKHLVSVKKKNIELTSKEFDLLKTLMEAHGRVLSRDYLLDQVWGYDQALNIETRTVDVHMLQLRKKLKIEAPRLVTVKNVGYRFDED